jgi:hypothetical protein
LLLNRSRQRRSEDAMGSKVVELGDLEWAIEFARYSTKHVARGVEKHMLEEYEQADLVEYVRQEFRRHIELTEGQLRKLCERKTKDHRNIMQAIYHLAKCDDIVELDRSSSPGRPTRKWQWQR